jgi:hypothetical protein
MLRSQLSAILNNFRRKIGVFLKNQCYDQFFFQKLAVVFEKNANCFGYNIQKLVTLAPLFSEKEKFESKLELTLFQTLWST